MDITCKVLGVGVAFHSHAEKISQTILCDWVAVVIKTHPNQIRYLKELKFRANYIICYSADPQCRTDQTRGSGIRLGITPFVWQVSYSYVSSSQGGSWKSMSMQESLTPMPGKGWNFLGLKSQQRQGKVRTNGKWCGRLPLSGEFRVYTCKCGICTYLSWSSLHLMQRWFTSAD
jgi:hypothetical protein